MKYLLLIKVEDFHLFSAEKFPKACTYSQLGQLNITSMNRCYELIFRRSPDGSLDTQAGKCTKTHFFIQCQLLFQKLFRRGHD